MAIAPTRTNGATPRSGQAFEQFLDEQLADSEFRAGFERELAKVKSVASSSPSRQPAPRRASRRPRSPAAWTVNRQLFDGC
jgi:hypothetical protein